MYKSKNFKSRIKTSGKIQVWLIDENRQSKKVFDKTTINGIIKA